MLTAGPYQVVRLPNNSIRIHIPRLVRYSLCDRPRQPVPQVYPLSAPHMATHKRLHANRSGHFVTSLPRPRSVGDSPPPTPAATPPSVSSLPAAAPNSSVAPLPAGEPSSRRRLRQTEGGTHDRARKRPRNPCRAPRAISVTTGSRNATGSVPAPSFLSLSYIAPPALRGLVRRGRIRTRLRQTSRALSVCSGRARLSHRSAGARPPRESLPVPMLVNTTSASAQSAQAAAISHGSTSRPDGNGVAGTGG
jgi:hypothetical protein